MFSPGHIEALLNVARLIVNAPTEQAAAAEAQTQPAKTPDSAAVKAKRSARNVGTAVTGGDTMLTGNTGADPALYTLGRNTLLGM